MIRRLTACLRPAGGCGRWGRGVVLGAPPAAAGATVEGDIPHTKQVLMEAIRTVQGRKGK